MFVTKFLWFNMSKKEQRERRQYKYKWEIGLTRMHIQAGVFSLGGLKQMEKKKRGS